MRKKDKIDNWTEKPGIATNISFLFVVVVQLDVKPIKWMDVDWYKNKGESVRLELIE